jgi:hypothetical protein
LPPVPVHGRLEAIGAARAARVTPSIPRIPMPTKTDFTPDEWNTLRMAPALVGGAMMAASPDGFFTSIREAFAMGSSSFTALKGAADVPLLKEIMTDNEKLVDALKAKLGEEKDPAARRQKMHAEALAAVKAAVAILAAKGTPADVAAYRSWIGSVAEGVANAASTGGFLGFGGEKVSEAEKAFLGEVQQALA